jgi:predicted NBD/HSP70 family sugar kinase
VIDKEKKLPNGSPALMRAINAARVIRELRSAGPMSRASIVRVTGLSKPTITNVVAYLESEGHIEQTKITDGLTVVGTARAQLYNYRAGRGSVLGIDLGADKILLVLADLDGKILGTRRLVTREISPFEPMQIFVEIQSATAELLATARGSLDSLLAVVVGTPGVVAADGVVTMAPQLPGWEGLNLSEALSAIFPCPVQIEREVALSLQAERASGVAQGIDNALFIHLGVGVAAGLLINGQIYRGAQGGAGEIGMMPLPAAITTVPSSGFGPFESLTGGIALQRRGRELALTIAGRRLKELAVGNADDVDAAVVFTAMREGDQGATELVRDVVASLAWGVSCLVCALNPQTIIIGGGLSRAADVFLPELQEKVAASVPFAPQWLVSGLGEEAVALGAIHQATKVVEQNLFVQADLRRSS